MLEPTGPVWQRAKAERNWLVYRLVQKHKGKPAKLPQLDGHNADRAVAARYTYSEARNLWTDEDMGVGYLPREGSAMVVLDLDGVLSGDKWQHDVLPNPMAYLTEESWAEVSPSGTGLHVLLPRDGWPTESIDGAGPIGLHASGAYFVTVSHDLASDQTEVAPAPRLMSTVLPVIEAALAERHSEQQAVAKGSGWFDTLELDDRVALALDVLMALPEAWVRDREHWLRVTFALRGYPELHEAWDVWSQQDPGGYDSEGNSAVWFGRERSGETIGIGSFLHWADEHGVDLRPYRAQASAARAQRLGARLEQVMPEEMAAATQVPSQRPHRGVEELLEEGLAMVVRHEPSGRYMHLQVPSTLTSSVRSTLAASSILRMYPVRMREPSEDEARPPTVGEEIVRRCHMTMKGPIADPRVPFGAAYPERHGIHDYVQVNRLRMREVKPGIKLEARHWALKAWREVLAQVFPVEAERAWVESWVACKAQRPWERMVAVLSVAITQGTGRGGFSDLIAALFGRDNCANITVEDLGGATAMWNDYLLALWVFVDELSNSDAQGMAGRNATRRRGYEVLKSMVDPRAGVNRRINVKHGDAYQATSFSTFFVASNHEDGLPIPDADRRFAVMQGNDARAEADFMKLVERLVASEEALDMIWAHLHSIDLSAFQPDVVLDTNAKANMVDASKSDFDVELEGLLEALGWPLLVTNRLVEQLVAVKGEMGKAMAKQSDGVTAKVKRWIEDNSRPLPGDANKGSRRVAYAGRTPERVRVLRQGEVGMKRSTVDDMTNTQVQAWLVAIEIDTMSAVVSGATACRKLKAGLRVVR